MKKKLLGFISTVVSFAIILSIVLTDRYGLFNKEEHITPNDGVISSTPQETPEKNDPEKGEEKNPLPEKDNTPTITPVITPPDSETNETLPEGEDKEASEELLPGQINKNEYPFEAIETAVSLPIALSASLSFKKSLLECDGTSLSVKQGHTSSNATISLDFTDISSGGATALHFEIDATEQTEDSLIKIMLKADITAEIKSGGYYYLIDNEGRIFRFAHSPNRSVKIPAGFKGYVVLDLSQYVLMKDQSAIDEASITKFLIQLQAVEKDVGKTLRFSKFGLYYDLDTSEEIYDPSYVSLLNISSAKYPYIGKTVDTVDYFNNGNYVKVVGGYNKTLGRAVSGRVRLSQLHSGISNGIKLLFPYSSRGYTAAIIEVDNTENSNPSWLKFGLETSSGIAYQVKGATSYLISRDGTYYTYQNTNDTISIAIPAGFKGNLVLPFETFFMESDSSAININDVKGLRVLLRKVDYSTSKYIYLDELSFVVGSLEANQIVETGFEFAGLKTTLLNDFASKTDVSCSNGIETSAATVENGRLRINLSHTGSQATVSFGFSGTPDDKVGIMFDIDASELLGASYIKFTLSADGTTSEIKSGGYYYLYSNEKYYKHTVSENNTCIIPKGFNGKVILSFDQLIYSGTNRRLDHKNLSGTINLQLHNVTEDSSKNVFIDNVSYITEKIPTAGAMNQVPLGGGGYVTGLVFHPLDNTILYARTDVGGIYRWDEDNNRWIQLSFVFGNNDRLYSVDGVAVDPNDKDVVYIAVGDGGGLGAGLTGVYKSSNRGESWQRILNIPFYGNSGGREYGECIQVDPNNSKVIYIGTRNKGLYYTRDGGVSWTQVDTNVIPINYTNYQDNPYGWRSIVIDSRTTVDSRSSTIYVAGRNGGIYSSRDGGNSWAKIEDAPADVTQIRLGANGSLYITAGSGVFIYNGVSTTDITPDKVLPSYCALDVDPTNPNRVIVCNEYGAKDRMEMNIYLSSDGGNSWTLKTMGRNGKYIKRDTLPWWPLYYFSSATACLVFRPDNPKEVWMADWYGIWMTYNIDETTAKIEWYLKVLGHEEVVSTDKLTLPEGPGELLIGDFDNGCIYIEDITVPPLKRGVTSSNIAYCYSQPNFVAHATAGSSLYISTNYGKSFTERPTTVSHINMLAISATNPDNIIVLGWGEVPHYTTDGGLTWKASEGATANTMTSKWTRQYIIEPDGVRGNIFYYAGAEGIYRSEDGGKSFTLVNTELADFTRIYSVYKREGLLYALKDNLLYVSTDYGENFIAVNSISSVECISFGVGKSRDELAYYAIGVIGGERGLYISNDYGATWELMRNSEGLTNFGSVIGDMQIYGRCYLSSGGLGIMVCYK